MSEPDLWADDASDEHRTGANVPTLFWACSRQLTAHWGCPTIYVRICEKFSAPDLVVGKTDSDFEGVSVDIDPAGRPTVRCDWNHLPFRDRCFDSSFWDPPYDRRYDGGLREILRVTRTRFMVLHQLIYPQTRGWHKEALIAVTTGPNMRIRCLQVWRRDGATRPADATLAGAE